MASTTYRVHFESSDCPPLLCVVPANTSISDYLHQNRPNLPADISSGYLHVVVQDKPSASDADTKSEEAEVINVFVAKNIWRAHELWKEAMLSQLLRRLTRLEHDYKDIKEGGGRT
ncbi:hypothetical protein BT96DRAFT_509474 [Gymnopus androsaceus JB14]|uniref:Uncharacterized protein n=1 Tax=Gymnopus androsaceus JB14 TaxID=1447944 RepID=A0A6A4GLZ4_9AGAR|nr:hypothetical protein BT96DRAFT_509474 [Gymnopus androsaceus JB14]